MQRKTFVVLLCALCVSVASGTSRAQEARLVVSVANQFGFPVSDLTAQDFTVTVDKAARPVTAARYQKDTLADIVLLLDTSEVGAPLRAEIQHVAALLINRLGEKDQMAIIGYAISADLVQEFTNSKTLLKRAVAGLKYGNRPALLDAMYAALNGAFEQAAGRRILVVISSGLDWRNKVDRREVIASARRNQVSVFAISFAGDGDLEKIAEQTAGHFYRGRELKQIQQLAENLASAFRGHYELALPGPPPETGRLKVEVTRGEKMRVGCRLAP